MLVGLEVFIAHIKHRRQAGSPQPSFGRIVLTSLRHQFLAGMVIAVGGGCLRRLYVEGPPLMILHI